MIEVILVFKGWTKTLKIDREMHRNGVIAIPENEIELPCVVESKTFQVFHFYRVGDAIYEWDR